MYFSTYLFQAQEERILDRETLIHVIAAKYSIRGFDVSPLQSDRVTDFTAKLASSVAQQSTEVERMHMMTA